MLDHPRLRIKPVSPALGGRCFITEPSGKPSFFFFLSLMCIFKGSSLFSPPIMVAMFPSLEEKLETQTLNTIFQTEWLFSHHHAGLGTLCVCRMPGCVSWSISQGSKQNGFVSRGCCNKLRQTGCLKTTEIFSLTVLEARSLKSRHWQGRAPSDSPRDEASWPLSAAGGGCQPWGSLTCGHIPPVSASVFPSHYPLFLLCICSHIALSFLLSRNRTCRYHLSFTYGI